MKPTFWTSCIYPECFYRKGKWELEFCCYQQIQNTFLKGKESLFLLPPSPKTFCGNIFAKYLKMLTYQHIVLSRWLSSSITYPKFKFERLNLKIWFARRDGQKTLTSYLRGMRIWKVNTHKKSSCSQVPCHCQAKAHVGFHLSNIGNARGSFQRGKDFLKWLNYHLKTFFFNVHSGLYVALSLVLIMCNQVYGNEMFPWSGCLLTWVRLQNMILGGGVCKGHDDST